MKPEDVPDTILDLAWRAELARRSPDASPELIEEYCDFDTHPSLRSHREELRPVLAAVLPAIERRVREQVAEQEGWTDGTMDQSLRILRMPCGHARLAFAHWPPQIPHRRFCLPCGREVGEGVEIARGEAR